MHFEDVHVALPSWSHDYTSSKDEHLIETN